MLVERIKGISIQGRCYENPTVLALFEDKQSGSNSTERRLSIVFGKNGSGKSTIADAFSQIARDAHSDAVGEPRHAGGLNAHLFDKDSTPVTAKDGEIFVFNEKYIDENVKVSTDGLGTIVLLGEKVGLQAQIDQCREDQEKAKERLEAADKKRKPFHDPQNPSSPDYHYNNIVERLRIGWQKRAGRIGEIEAISSSVIEMMGGMTPAGAYEDLLETFENQLKELQRFRDAENITFHELPTAIGLGEKKEDELRARLAGRFWPQVLNERETRIMNVIRDTTLSFEVADTREYFENPAADFCPCCFRPISRRGKKNIIQEIDVILNKDVEEHVRKLSSFAEVLRDAESKANSIIDSLKEENQRSFDALGIGELVWHIQAAAVRYLEGVLSCLDGIQFKCKHPYTPVEMNAYLAETERTLNSLLEQYSDVRKKYGQNQWERAGKIENMRAALHQLNREIAALEIAQSYAEYQRQTAAKNECETEYAARQEEYDTISDRLNQLLRADEDAVIATGKINSLLDYVFFHKGRLSIDFENNTYRLKANGKDVRPMDVSSGERNIIALCYFFTQLLSGQKEAEFYKRKMLVVIDDPVSSFDYDNKVGIMTLLRYQLKQIITGCPDSKALVLSHDITTVLDLGKAAREICTAVKNDGRLKTEYHFWELKNRGLVRFSEKSRFAHGV